MSLAINTTTPEGMVLAADSRQSYRNRKKMARIGSDSASKVFQINDRIGVAITGLAFLQEEGVLKNVSKFIDQFKYEVDTSELTVDEVAKKLHYLFNKKYNWQEQLEKLPIQIENDLKNQGLEVLEKPKIENHVVKFRFKDRNGNINDGAGSVDPIVIMVAGYDHSGSHSVYVCNIPGEIENHRDSKEKNKEYGANWIGQTDVVTRIILGFDNRIGNIKFVKEAMDSQGKDAINKQLRNLEYAINWGTMTLQDAVDFCTLAIKTTSAIQKFSDGIAADPGDMPGVGGEVDLAVITPDKGFVWINKKGIQIDDKTVDLEAISDLPKEKIKPKRSNK
ncbi:hypothetical protein A2V71_00770 [Candidatus Berkelbacteria bacterium RBG_13_40_8]|uniref:Uncharacterized protein n=1 Tax=Candidatus Berkelbacteria bacterium RBG_13_40_8 TaxID=1797467 RepID=A0A1F5DQ87_9BACT|nr:MAG: hypothetical protein A2V71_00770 [Candidatus Berkelbacteria bacterium RBG_13_40_8]